MCVTEQTIVSMDKQISLTSIINVQHPKESFYAVFKKREGGMRHVVIMVVLLFGLYNFQCMGVKLISLSYARNEFLWASTNHFNEWWSSYSAVQVYFYITNFMGRIESYKGGDFQ